MEKIMDLHTHLETLHPVLHLRSKLQSHLIDLKGHFRENKKIILSVGMYVQAYQKYQDFIPLIKEFTKEIESFGSRCKLIKTKADLESDYEVGILYHVESARCITEIDSQLPELFDLGVRGIIPIHFVNNIHGQSCDDPRRRFGIIKDDAGLSDKGFKFVEKMNELEMWLDLAHTTDRTADQMLELTKFPMCSHIGIRDLKNQARSKTISFYQKMAKQGGIFGLTPWVHLIGTEEEAYSKNIACANNNDLGKAICIGTDFGAPIKSHKTVRSIFDLAEIADGFDNAEDIKWNNGFDFYKRALPN